jgi:hypothetical protein
MKKSQIFQIFIVGVVSIAILLLVYSPHFDYRFPYHIDEWHHISEAIKLRSGEYSGGTIGFRVGFHIILLVLSSAVNLVSVYRFFPALWAVVSALVLFYVVYKKTNKFLIALFSMLFFASIKSNTNITGLWFFTPLSFSIPFIFLYVYFFTEGIEKQNKKFILLSLVIMAFILVVHPISVIFAMPFLGIYSLMHFKYIKSQYKFFSSFLIIPVIGMLFYSHIKKIPLTHALQSLVSSLQFKYGWGVLEVSNAFTELYSIIGYVFAVIGTSILLIFYKKFKKYLIYILWPASVLVFIIIYRLMRVSYLTPYQRNLYYFAIGLPILSAFGLFFLIDLLKSGIKLKIPYLKQAISLIVIVIVIFFTFKSYFDVPERLELYKVIDDDDYKALLFLRNFPETTVLAFPMVSVALHPISGHKPVATLAFYGNRKESEKFFLSSDCQEKQQLINEYGVEYVLSKFPIDCGWKLIYAKNNFIYKVS